MFKSCPLGRKKPHHRGQVIYVDLRSIKLTKSSFKNNKSLNIKHKTSYGVPLPSFLKSLSWGLKWPFFRDILFPKAFSRFGIWQVTLLCGSLLNLFESCPLGQYLHLFGCGGSCFSYLLIGTNIFLKLHGPEFWSNLCIFNLK